MARRESQGLQIALIIFVMLTVVLVVTTIMFANKSKRLDTEVVALRSENASAKADSQTAIDNAIRLKVWIGHAGETSMEDIEARYNKDMQTYIGNVADVQRNYLNVPTQLLLAVQERHRTNESLNQQLKQLNEEIEKTRTTMQQEIDKANAVQAQTELDSRKMRDDFTAERNQLNEDKAKLAAQVDATRNVLTDLKQSSEQTIARLTKEVADARSILADRDKQLATLRNESFEVPDGRITRVNPKLNSAYINLGTADGLRRQVTFSVYDVDVNNLAREIKKGGVEVIQVVSDHLSEVKITDEDPSNPILPGDVIYTPLWNSRSAMRFALAGVMDIDGDGQDDRQRIKHLITLNNGKIDAEEKGGEITGEMTRNTRYLIRGETPVVSDTSEGSSTALQDAWSKMINDAARLGVEEISVEKLLDFMSYDGEKRTVPLGRDARAEDFFVKPKFNSSGQNRFRQRRPPAGVRNGDY